MFVLPLDLMQPLPALIKAINKREQVFFDLNEQQLDRGLDSAGKDLGKYARFSYKGRYRPVDLKKTGAWRDRFTLVTDQKQTTLFSQDEKDDTLIERWGVDIHGVPKNNLYVLGPYLINDMTAEVRRKLFRR